MRPGAASVWTAALIALGGASGCTFTEEFVCREAAAHVYECCPGRINQYINCNAPSGWLSSVINPTEPMTFEGNEACRIINMECDEIEAEFCPPKGSEP